MSVSLLEVIEAGGYDLKTLEDAQWLLSKRSEFDELVDNALVLVEGIEDEEARLAELEYRKTFPEEE